MVKSYAILGPFQDTGGGVMRHEGPEAAGERWNDTHARFSWGVYDVAWRRVLPSSATPRGVPLDLYIHPRAESCTYLASRVTVPSARPILVHVGEKGKAAAVLEAEESLRELAELSRTAGVGVMDTILQLRDHLDPKFVMGKGKLDEVVLRAADHNGRAANLLGDPVAQGVVEHLP